MTNSEMSVNTWTQVPTEGDAPNDPMPSRIAAGPMGLVVYIREDRVAAMLLAARTPPPSPDDALRVAAKNAAEWMENEAEVMEDTRPLQAEALYKEAHALRAALAGGKA